MRLAALIAFVLVSSVGAQTLPAPAASAPTREEWSLATRTDDHRTTLYRYLTDPGGNAAEREKRPDRVTLSWHYDGAANHGMPGDADTASMDAFENALDAAVERDAFARLVLVKTGGGAREWTYYAVSGQAFMQRIAGALKRPGNAAIDIDVTPDPRWTAWDDFVRQVTSR